MEASISTFGTPAHRPSQASGTHYRQSVRRPLQPLSMTPSRLSGTFPGAMMMLVERSCLHCRLQFCKSLESLDQAFFRYPNDLTTLLYRYVSEHRDQIGAPVDF